MTSIDPRPSGIRFFNTFEPVTGLYRELIPHLAARGAHVTIYVSRGVYRSARDLEAFVASLPSVQLRRLLNLGLHARRGTAAKAVIGLLYFLDASIRTLFSPGRYRNVFLTQPPYVPVLGLLLSRVRNQPYCVILMDLQPQLAAAVGLVRPASLAYRILDRLNRAALGRADRVVVIGRCMAETVRREGIRDDVDVIPNWADPDEMRPIPHRENALRRDMDWGNEFIVMYAGTLGYAQSMDGLVGAAEDLAENRGIRIVIIGEGVRRPRLEARVAEMERARVELHPFLHDAYSLSEILSAADLHFVSLHPDVTGLAVPSKTYGILAVGRPFLFQGDERSEIARLIEETGVGLVVPPGETHAISAAVRALAADRDRVEAMGSRARAVAEAGWRATGGSAAYEDVLAELEASRRRSEEPR